jgi:hypothetical protein
MYKEDSVEEFLSMIEENIRWGNEYLEDIAQSLRVLAKLPHQDSWKITND